jgi:hypothetical protein
LAEGLVWLQDDDGLNGMNEEFLLLFSKRSAVFFMRAAAPPTPRASCSFLKKRTKKLSFDHVLAR